MKYLNAKNISVQSIMPAQISITSGNPAISLIMLCLLLYPTNDCTNYDKNCIKS